MLVAISMCHLTNAVQHATNNTGVMQQVTLVLCIIFKYCHATEQHFECCPK